AEYKEQFPNAEIVSAEVKEKIRNKHKGKPKSEETKRKVSESIKKGFANGRQVHNKGQKGHWRSMSDEEKNQRSLAAQNRPPVSDETRRKMGLKSKGRKKSKEQIEKWKSSFQKFLKENGGSPQKGYTRSDEFKERMSEIAKNRDPE